MAEALMLNGRPPCDISTGGDPVSLRTPSDLLRFIEKCRAGGRQTVKVVYLGKGAARALLANQNNPRSINAAQVAKFQRIIDEERWCVVDPIHIWKDGRLGNGQHRLFGFLRSDKDLLPVLLYFGVGIDEQSAIDSGTVRTPTVIAKAAGVADRLTGSHISVACQMLAGCGRPLQVSPYEKCQIADHYFAEVDFVVSRFSHSGVLHRVPIQAAWARAAQTVDKSLLAAWMAVYLNGASAGLHVGKEISVMLRLREAMLQPRVARVEQVYKVQRSIKACEDGEELQKLLMPRGAAKDPYPILDTSRFEEWGLGAFAITNIKKYVKETRELLE